MIFDHEIVVPVARDRVWAFMMDIPAVAGCLPGVESVEPIGVDTYKGTMRVRVGPVSLSLNGQIHFEQRDHTVGSASLKAEATDRKVGGAVRATLGLRLTEISSGETRIAVHTDASLLGKIGEFGQGVIRKKADSILAEFAENVKTRLSAA